MADPEILKTGGGGVGVSASSLFIACAQNAFLSGKRRLAEKNARANGRRRASPIAPLWIRRPRIRHCSPQTTVRYDCISRVIQDISQPCYYVSLSQENPFKRVFVCLTAGTLVPSSVNGDIAIQWEWSNVDPSQNPNTLTDYDKTLHNWLRPRYEDVTQNLCQSAVTERLAKCVTSAWIFLRKIAQNTRCELRSAFWGSTRWPTTFWGTNS